MSTLPAQEVPLSKLQTCQKKITLVCGGSECQVNILIAMSTCGTLLATTYGDSCLTHRFTIEGASEGNFKSIETFLNTLTCEVTPSNALYLYEMAARLGCGRLAEHVKPVLAKMDLGAVGIDYLRKIFDLGGDCGPLVEFWANRLCDGNLDDFTNLPAPLLDMILRVTKAPPAKILALLRAVFDWRTNPNHRLAQYLPLREMPAAERREFLCHPALNLNRIKSALMRINTEDGVPTNREDWRGVITYDPEKPFSGFLHSTTEYSFNSSSIASGPGRYDAQVLVQDDLDGYFCTDAEAEPSLEVKFSSVRFAVSGYVLKSWPMASNGVAPVAWDLMVTFDGRSWIVVDHREDETGLVGNYAVQYFEVPSEMCDMFALAIKFVQRRTANPGNSRLALSGFDIYGSYQHLS